MALVEEDFDELFSLDVQSYKAQGLALGEIKVTEFIYTNFNVSNQTVDASFKFDRPNELGLNTEKSDFILFTLNSSYPWNKVLSADARMLEDKPLQTKMRSRIELTFDYDNKMMQTVVEFARVFLFIMLGFVVIQILLLLYKNVGLLTFWVLFDYAQLIAYLPLMTSRCVPFVYDAFRPFLVSHFIFEYPGNPGLENLVHDDFMNLSFRAYHLKTDDLFYMSGIIWAAILFIIIVSDIAVSCAVKSTECCKTGCLHKCLLVLQS